MPIRAVFFDMGDTLVYSDNLRQNFVERIHSILAKHVEIDREDIAKAFGNWDSVPYRVGLEEHSDELRIMLLLKRVGLPPAPTLVKELREAVVKIWVESYVFEEDAAPTLSRLKDEGYIVGIISNAGSYDIVEGKLEEGGLLELVDVVVVSEAIAWKKPSPVIFRVAVDMVGVEPSEAVHVGDNPVADIEGAKRAGLWAIQKLKPGVGPSPYADYAVTRIEDVPAVIRKLNELLSSEACGDKA